MKTKSILNNWIRTFFVINLIISTICNPFSSMAQDKEGKNKEEGPKSYRELFAEAAYHIEFKSFNLALPVYLEMDSMQPENANTLYKIGYCYVQSANEKSRAIKFLERALKSATKNYDDLAYTEKNAPLSTYWELAKAYHLNNQIDTAIGTYKRYGALINKKHYMQEEITRRIEMCNFAKKQIANPINVEITNLGKGINTKDADFGPILTADESMLIFTSRREVKGAGEANVELDGTYFEDIYVSYNDSGTWRAPEPIGSSINQIGEHDAAIGLSADGQRLFVYKPDGGGDIYQSYLMGDIWTVPDRLSDNINSDAWETHATISSDGQTLYFVSDRKVKGGIQFGGRDIYKSTMLPTGEWSEAVNMGENINSQYEEDAPFIHPNGKILYFSSKGHQSMGGFDIFFSELQDDGTWSPANNLGYPINTTNDDIFYVETPDGKRAYYSSVNVEKGYGEKDIYMIELTDNKEIPLTILKGTMAVSNLEGIPLDAKIVVTDKTTGKETIYKPNSETGKFLVVLPEGDNYEVAYMLDDSTIAEEKLELADNSSYQEIEKTITLKGEIDTKISEVTETAEVVETVEAVEVTETPEVVETVETVEVTETPEVVEAIVVKSFQEFFNYNVKSIKTSSRSYKTLIGDLAKLAKQSGSLTLTVEASASKVPTEKYGTNENLAQKRGETAKATLLSSLKAKGVTVSVDVNINPVVQGPDFNEDAIENKDKYERYQYVKISVK